MSYIAVYCHIYLNWYASKSFLPDWRFLPEYPTTHVEHSTRLEVSTRLPEYLYPNTYPSNFHQADVPSLILAPLPQATEEKLIIDQAYSSLVW